MSLDVVRAWYCRMAIVTIALALFAGCGSEEDGPWSSDGIAWEDEDETPTLRSGGGGGEPSVACTSVDILQSYDDVDSLRNTQLINALRHRIKSKHQAISYDNAKKYMFNAKNGIDVREGSIECIYTGDLYSPQKLDQNDGFNTEHSWPQSMFGSEPNVAKGDMHHLFPAERDMNTCRGNYPFGETKKPDNSAKCVRGGSKRGISVTSSERVFEVRPQYRGDIARAQFYFAVRYGLKISAEQEEVLRAWHEQDPPDDIECVRNHAIESYQNNRNPFIDRPEFVNYIADF